MKNLTLQVTLLFSTLFFIFPCEDQVANLEDESMQVRMVIQETQYAYPWEMVQNQNEYENNIKVYLQTYGVEESSLEVLDELPAETALCAVCNCWS